MPTAPTAPRRTPPPSTPTPRTAILICVDGTGKRSSDDHAYDDKMKTGFVADIANNSPLWGRYYRGPGATGTGTYLEKPAGLIPEIKQRWEAGEKRILMTGFSRGGAIVINAAALLKAHKIEVEALFLFDAVDRSCQLEARLIPSNVQHAYHALRDPEAKSRESFANCGLAIEGGAWTGEDGDFARKTFFTTHGGMGGTLWGKRGLKKALGLVDHPYSEWDNRPVVPDQPIAAGSRVVEPSAFDFNGRTIARTALTPARPQSARDDLRKKAERDRIMKHGYIDEGIPDGQTKVTMAEEAAGLQEVRRWMWRFLRKHGVIV